VSDAATVPGIATRIDRDRFVGTDLLDGTIASLIVDPAVGGTIAGERIACGGAELRCERLANPGDAVELVATPDPGMSFLGWSDACASWGTEPACTVHMRGRRQVSAVFRPTITLPEDGEGTSFRWGAMEAAGAIGGSYRWDHLAGARQVFAFEGGAVTLFTVAGPAMGKARISIDGDRRFTLDGWAPLLTFGVPHRFDGLGPGRHTLAVTALGIARERAAGTGVGIDALRWGRSVRADPKIMSGAWAAAGLAAATDGSYAASDVSGATAELSFEGAGVSWLTAHGPRMGSAQIWVDGKFVRTVDLFAPTRKFGSEEVVTGLKDASHVIQIVVVPPSGRPGRTVVVDGWTVR
jgi:hypothetical protein